MDRSRSLYRKKKTMITNSLRHTIKIQGVNIDVLRVNDLYEKILALIRNGGKHLITYTNIHTMNIAYYDKVLLDAYANSSVVYCDGAGIKLGARLVGEYLPERMTGATFIHDFCKRWQDEGIGLFFLGGLPGVANKACRCLKKRYPQLKISGNANGYFQRNSSEEDEILEFINQSKPDILFVGFGTPLQEHWCLQNWNKLDDCLIWPIGAIVDYLSGRVPRCPQSMEVYNMEWLFRLIIEPHRMFVRYVIGNPLFIHRILRNSKKGILR